MMMMILMVKMKLVKMLLKDYVDDGYDISEEETNFHCIETHAKDIYIDTRGQ